ncbi:acyl carrier protein [Streptomyces sp. ME02-6987-2C]|uniref:acyl carrier protein n=1 Tax=unclassified Streptomyces TaxID=2593676 RepID=UPI00087C9123|nr:MULTISPECIES: acyl carrier protein [unclassified Streptomyces]MDX3367437.1 acyl carrier protein [Streptomyces sp. ME02-6987-2C]MDX3423747.1 acyl carrier protein [Streptomyces sp. ME02-6985-2c]REH20645.1 acyl carrier protein [Streptomyces sp. 2221.1]SDT31146.1 acyl carrier protein [Streptomyces sp. 2114.2]
MNQTLKTILTGPLQVDEDSLRPEASLEDAGLDSLAIAELDLLLAEQGVALGEDRIASVTTVGALDQLVDEHLAGR